MEKVVLPIIQVYNYYEYVMNESIVIKPRFPVSTTHIFISFKAGGEE